MDIKFFHNGNIYIKRFDINEMCTSFDYDLDEDILRRNITSVLVKDCVIFNENQKVGVEIPEWGMKYDIILKSNSIRQNTESNVNVQSSMTTIFTDIGTLDDTNQFHTDRTLVTADPNPKCWTKLATKLLIENRGELDHEFNSNKKNYKIWEKIADELKKSGITVTGPNCNTKFRNLMGTFKDNLQRANKSGESAINWEYYEEMKKYFGKKDAVAPKKNTLLQSSLPNCTKNGNKLNQSNSLQSTDNMEINSDEELILPKKKKKNNSFQEILLEEIKQDRKSRDAFQNKLENFMDKLIQIETAKLEKK